MIIQGASVGIDLGTTKSCVGVWHRDDVVIITNGEGDRTTPSFVASTENNDRLVGQPAKDQATRNSGNTLHDAKRLIGSKFDDHALQSRIKHWPFKVSRGAGDKPQITVDFMGQSRTFTPEEISSMVLTKMKEVAEVSIGSPVTNAVITVPACFNEMQRQATKEAATMAGLNVLRLMSEPTTAAIAYGFNMPTNYESTVMIFDLGGGTCDVSLVTIDDGSYEVRATAGDPHLGGEDFDTRLVDHLAAEIRRRYRKDIMDHQRALRRLRMACETAKRTLSTATQAQIQIDWLFDGVDFATTITRACFEGLCADDFAKTIHLVEKVLRDANMSKAQVAEVVLVGGSSRIPKVQQLLSAFFNGKQVCRSVNPDEAVAFGATMLSAFICGNDSSAKLQDFLALDVTSYSIGVETAGGAMTTMIQRNMPIPTRKTKTFTTYVDDQESVLIQVFQGERSITRDNTLVRKFLLDGIAPMPRSMLEIKVTIDVDADGAVAVGAIAQWKSHYKNGTSNNLTETRMAAREYTTLCDYELVCRQRESARDYDLVYRQLESGRNRPARDTAGFRMMEENETIEEYEAAFAAHCDEKQRADEEASRRHEEDRRRHEEDRRRHEEDRRRRQELQDEANVKTRRFVGKAVRGAVDYVFRSFGWGSNQDSDPQDSAPNDAE